MLDDMKLSGQELDSSEPPCRFHSPSRGQVLIWEHHGEPNERNIKVCFGGVCHNLICRGNYDEADHLLRKYREVIGPTDADLLLLVADCDLMLRVNEYFCRSVDLERIRLLLLLLPLEELTQWGLELQRNNRSISAIILFHVACNMKLRCEEPRPPDYQQWINYFLSNAYSSAETLLSTDRRSCMFVGTSAITFMGRMKNMAVNDNIASSEYRITIEAVFDSYLVSLFIRLGRYAHARDIASRRITQLEMCIRRNPHSEYYSVKGDLLCNRGQSFFNLGMLELASRDFGDAIKSYQKITHVPLEKRLRLVSGAEGRFAMVDKMLQRIGY